MLLDFGKKKLSFFCNGKLAIAQDAGATLVMSLVKNEMIDVNDTRAPVRFWIAVVH